MKSKAQQEAEAERDEAQARLAQAQTFIDEARGSVEGYLSGSWTATEAMTQVWQALEDYLGVRL